MGQVKGVASATCTKNFEDSLWWSPVVILMLCEH